jgi:integrase/recombinase XerD
MRKVVLMDTRQDQVRIEQIPLFPQPEGHGVKGLADFARAPLTRASSLSAAMAAFYDHMYRRDFSEHTIQAFIADLRLLARHRGYNVPLGEFGLRDLNDFLDWLVEYRGVPCSPKTYARRVTTLKVFFAWLHEIAVLDHDPAVAIPHHRVVTPLPHFLFDDQVALLLKATRTWMVSDPQPDARPHLLVSLLLATGIKKGECMAIALWDIDRSRPTAPVLHIRYTNPRYRHKERKLALPPDLIPALDGYLASYRPQQKLFECTPRNLEYVLAEAGQRARLPMMVSFEMLRWTCAVRDFQNGMEERHLRDKLGLSQISWRETVAKLRKLAGPAL